MQKIVAAAVAGFPGLGMEQVNGLIALGALGLAWFAIYVVFEIAKERRK